MKKIFLILFSSLLSQQLMAQDEYEILRYANGTHYGTARGISIGGAVGSIGADFSSLSVNPAGIGVYKSSEFSISPSFLINKNQADYLGTQTTNQHAKLNMNSFGLVMTNKKGLSNKKTHWKTVSFGFGMNRIANFNNQYKYVGTNKQSSLIERYAQEYNQWGGLNNTSINKVSYPAYAAYQTYLVDYGTGADSLHAVSYVPYWDSIKQTKSVKEKGFQQEYVLSLGANYNEKLMLGATLGIQSINYYKKTVYSEEDLSGKLNNDFNYFDLEEVIATSGTGINLKLGAIAKPNKALRLGIALHTPTHLELNDQSQIYMESHTDSLLLYNDPTASPISSYSQDSIQFLNYSITTPYKVLGSVAVLLNKSGFITGDIEYVDYSSMRYNFRDFSNFSDALNTQIQSVYKNNINVRIGGELKLDQFSIRGGFAYYGSPFKNTNIDASKKIFSGGIGYRTRYWFIDAAYQYRLHNITEQPYVLTNKQVEAASIKNTNSAVTISLGWKF
ncbi:MAG: hypothetical protein R2831_10235 [Chitinophagaceae bacterium]